MTDNAIEPINRRVIHLEGNVDLEQSPNIRKVLLGAVEEGRAILVDMAEVTYIDSSGIACLVEALQVARKKGADLALISVSMQAMRVLALARLDLVFTIHDDLTSAVGATR